MEDSLEAIEVKRPEVPSAVKTLTVLTYIGKSAILILLFWFFFQMESIFSLFESTGNSEGDQFIRTGMGMIRIVLSVFMIIISITIIGARLMAKGKKLGYVLFVIGNGILCILFVAAALNPDNQQDSTGAWIFSILFGLFIYLYSRHYKVFR